MVTKYLEQGINTIAVNENKQAIFPWKVFQEQMVSEEELSRQMGDNRAKGVAIICGAVSGNVEVIDIDTKYETFDLWSAIKDAIPHDLFLKLHIVKTRSNGKHLIYKCEAIEGNQKLAQRLPTLEERKNNPSIKSYCIIETRGEGGYVVAPPTDGYLVEQEGINVISLDEREVLFEIMRSFNEIFEEQVIEAHQRPSTKEYGVSPFDDYNRRGDIVGLMERNGWKVVKQSSERIYFLRPGSGAEHSGSFNIAMGLFSVFSVNTPFQVQKGYKLSAVFAIMECGSDFKLAARKLLDMGYGEKKTSFGDRVEIELFTKRNDGASKDDLVTILVKKHNKSVDDAKVMVDELDARWGEEICTFWDVDDKGVPSINRYKLQVFLTTNGGFRLYFYDMGSTIYRLVRVKDGFVEEASTEQIKRFIKDYIDKLPDSFDGGVTPQDLLELVYKGATVLFSDAFFEFFERADLEFLKDTKDEAYFPFKNGVVVVSKKEITLKSYGELRKVVWKTQVIDHFVIIERDIELSKIEYFRFIERISDNDQERYIYALGLIGYLLHNYKDPSRPFSVILAEEAEKEANGGGTGKGIFVKALGYLLNIVRVDGKNFKFDKSFAFQRVDLDTRILAIEDTRRNVDFEGFYSIITEGITVEKKNKDELFIPYKDSPKVMFTTNYTIPNSGNHAKRRQKVLEFSGYFGPTRTPEDEFGHKLFDDWDKDEWNRFYNLMFEAVQGYLECGVLEVAQSDKIKRKQIRVQFGEEFLEFLLGVVEEQPGWIKLEQLYNDFMLMSGFDKKDYSVKRFTKGIEESCYILNIMLKNKRDKGSGGKKLYNFNIEKKTHDEFF
jgi:hypothetical protein